MSYRKVVRTVEVKAWYQSKTVWAGALQVGAGAVLGLTEVFQSAGLEPAWLLGLAGVLNVVLRFVTGSPIKK